MGGSGGFSGYTNNVKSNLFSSTKNAQLSQRELEINEFLESLLKNFNNRDSVAIQRHLKEIEKVLGKNIDGLDKILFGGSISKKTFIEGTSDVDALVFLDKSLYKNASPKELQDIFYKMLTHRFPNTQIDKGTLAVTVKFSDYEIQLLPAFRENGKVQIADKTGNGWSRPINTLAFTDRLTKTNKMNNNKVIPVIKIVKDLFNNLPKKYQLSGYHIEALAVDAFSSYTGRATLYDMTNHLLKHSIKRVLSPMVDVTGQSGTIDSDLGSQNSIQRQQVSYHIKDISKRFSESDATFVKKELFN